MIFSHRCTVTSSKLKTHTGHILYCSNLSNKYRFEYRGYQVGSVLSDQVGSVLSDQGRSYPRKDCREKSAKPTLRTRLVLKER